MAQMMLTAARAAIPLVGQAVTGALLNGFGRGRRAGPRLPEFQLQTSTPGTSMPQVWGRVRLAGQVIWAARYQEHATTSRPGGKGTPEHVNHTYSLSFAVGLCAGEIAGIGRIWANGQVLDAGQYAWRLHTGSEDQLPDALIAAIEGEAAPAFRGTAYLVFEDLPLDAFGHRIPNLSVEVFRPGRADGLESQVQAVNLIPGSGEFAYQTETVVQTLGPGRAAAENRLPGRAQSNLLSAIDELERDLPNCRSIQLVVSWFGTDLRCGQCEIRPGVESRDKQTRPVHWAVAGTDRETARLVSRIEGRPAYGGTPDDTSIIAAIRALKARGFAVTLYPFILMDIAPGNGLPDPYGGGEQAVFPWRGRIRPVDDPADGPDIVAQIADFFGSARAADFPGSDVAAYSGPEDWRFNRFILHCAALARAAGGVDGFLIGSEMVALTSARAAAGFPAVDHFCALATEVRVVLGSGTRLSYAADWTEYSGVQDGAGEKIFHLDPLWAHPAIDAVAIDWYVPLGDWRDGPDHLDAAHAAGPHDRDYLASQVAGGEGWDWFYASPEDRAAQRRTPITDEIHGEAWVWRYKDLHNWWRQAHHDRPGGVRATQPTGWVPQSKPIWLTEIGCPAVDLGANQPNVFVDPKSAESAVPHASSGVRDDLIQRRYIEAMLAHWSSPENNPVSTLYGGRMVPEDLIHVWTWDARPWPDFPARTDIWSDGVNWQFGHWLNGRAGLVPVADIVSDLVEQAGLDPIDVSGVDDLVAGFVAQGGAAVRDTLEPLMGVFGLRLVDASSGPRLLGGGTGDVVVRIDDPAVASAGAADHQTEIRHTEVRHGGALDRLDDVRLQFFDEARDYETGSARAGQGALTGRCQTWALPLVAHDALARDLCRNRLDEARSEPEQAFVLAPKHLALEGGDPVAMGDYRGRIAEMDGGLARSVRLAPTPVRRSVTAAGLAGVASTQDATVSEPLLMLADLPALPGEHQRQNGLVMTAACEPWPGPFTVETDRAGRRSGAPRWEGRGQIDRPGVVGHLLGPVTPAPAGRWDCGSVLEVELASGTLSSLPGDAVFDGGNLLAVQTEYGGWEVLQFAQAVLVGDRRYQLTHLLWGQTGKPPGMLAAGAPCFIIDAAVAVLPVRAGEWGEDLRVRAILGNQDQAEPVLVRYSGSQGLQPAPVHLQCSRSAGGVALRWQRSSTVDPDDWNNSPALMTGFPERYRILARDPSGNPVFEAEADQPGHLLSADTMQALQSAGLAHIDLSIHQFGPDGRAGWACVARLDL